MIEKNTNLKKSLFSENYIGYYLVKMRNLKALWVDNNVFPCKEDFVQQFSYGLPNNELFNQIDFDFNKTKFVYAERYGGLGVGDNGGGVRCANDGPYQIKGTGKNILVGSEQDKWHSYGGLNAIDAVYETIISQTLKNILPIGVAEYYGIIHTGSNTAYNYEEKIGHGALLVREVCLRPAHFLRAPLFTPKPEFKSKVYSDLYRIRRVIKELLSSFSNTNELILYIGNFILKSANQFAFSSVARICHGSVGPSNLSYDGRWLDLTNASFLPTGANYGGPYPFYNEARSILDIIADIIYTISKYGQTELNPAPLVDYYKEIYNKYFLYHTNYAYGLPYLEENHSFENYNNLHKLTKKIIASGNKVIYSWPDKIADNDQMLSLVSGLYQGIIGKKETNSNLKNLCIRYNCDYVAVTREFNKLAMESYKCNKINIPYDNFLESCFIRSLNRIYISELFYKGRLENIIKNLIDNFQLDSIEKIIHQANRISHWAFDKEWKNEAVVFESDSESILYNGKTGNYQWTFKKNEFRITLSSIEQVISYASHSNPNADYNMLNFDVKEHIKRHGKIILMIKGKHDHEHQELTY